VLAQLFQQRGVLTGVNDEYFEWACHMGCLFVVLNKYPVVAMQINSRRVLSSQK
jgi:hypothetical protein